MTDIYDEYGNLTPEWYRQQRDSLRAFQGANGLWYAATVDADGFHRQGVGQHDTAEQAIRAGRERYADFPLRESHRREA